MSNADIKMSNVFDLPVQSGADDCVYDLHYNRICTSGNKSKEISHAINSHDALVEQNKALKLALVELETFHEKAFAAHPNIDIDIEALE